MVHQIAKHRSFRSFVILVTLVVVSGIVLWSQGDLISPLQSTTLLVGLSSGDAGFAMVGEPGARPQPAEDTASTETATAETAVATPMMGTMTLETFTAELAAAGVDVETVSATMAAEGRSLDNLLAVVNSGRVTVADLAARLKGESASEETPAPQEGTGLLDVRWDELGSVLYDLWLILAVTVLVIVAARPVGWLVNRIKRQRPTDATLSVSV